MTTPTPDNLTYDSERLIHAWRERFTGRRTVARELLDQAEVLVREAITLELVRQRAQAKTDRERELDRREWAIERAEALPKYTENRLRAQLAEAEAKIASMSPRMTLMREERETVEDGTVVRLLAPKVPSYGDKSEPRPWMLGEIEDVVHRLRMGGAEDDTELRFKRDAIEACVPFAEFALAPASTSRLADLQDQLPEGRPGGVRVDWRVAVGAVLVLLAIVTGVVIL